jgi:aminocarboxymuconate-semialdehyde decarboxylase
MLGRDYPYIRELHPVDHIFATTSLSDEEMIAILGGNAARVLGMKV